MTDLGQHPEVTVVVTTKNRPAQLARALASALHQQGVSLEVVVVDDASAPPADPPADARLRLVRHEQSQGACAARNAGTAVACGRWITFLDDDDELLPGALGRATTVLSRADDQAAISTVTAVDDATGTVTAHRPHSVSRGADWLAVPRFFGAHAHNSLVASTAVLRRIGGFDPTLPTWEHDDLFLRLVLEVDLVAIDEPGYLMHEDHRRPSLRTRYAENARAILITLQRHDDVHGPVPHVTADAYAIAGWNWARAGQRRPALHCFRAALHADPGRARTWVRLAYAVGGDTVYRASRPAMRRVQEARGRRARSRFKSAASGDPQVPAGREAGQA
jgi:glycosyltransferase involved in cell wall biosynthesis